MEERKFVKVQKDEFAIREFVKNLFGKGKVSNIKIEYTPVGEKIVVSTHKPGLIIGKGGEKIEKLTEILRKKFKMENPHIEIDEIREPDLDAKLVADDIALSLERLGPLKFKVIGYKTLQRIKYAGGLGAEIRLSGRLPSERAKSWRFAFGYLKKTGDSSKVVDHAQATGYTSKGVVGVKVSILRPDAHIHDKVELTEDLMNKIRGNAAFKEEEEIKPKKKKKKEVSE